jgi:hypothetical protein
MLSPARHEDEDGHPDERELGGSADGESAARRAVQPALPARGREQREPKLETDLEVVMQPMRDERREQQELLDQREVIRGEDREQGDGGHRAPARIASHQR